MGIGKCTNSHGYSPFLVIAVCHIVGVRTTYEWQLPPRNCPLRPARKS